MVSKTLIAAALGLSGLVTSIVGIIVAASANKKMKAIAKTVNHTVDELSNADFKIDISQDFVECAAKARVERDIDQMLPGVKKDAIKSATNVFNAAVNTEINEQYNDTKTAVKAALIERIGKLDISRIRREVEADVKYEAKAELKADLKNVIEQQTAQIRDINDIYKSIKAGIQGN